jgi:uncharacterized protein with HEPN domain
MPRSLLKYLLDIELAIEDIERFTAGKELADYETDTLAQAGVERKFTIIGEAFAQMEHHYPGSRDRIQEARHIVAFRNLLIHNYGEVVQPLVFSVVRGSMPALKLQVTQWITEIDTHHLSTS